MAGQLSSRLGRLSRQELEAWLEAAPVVEHQLFESRSSYVGFGTIGPQSRPKKAITIANLAEFCGSPVGVAALIAGLDSSAATLLEVAAWHGGALPRGVALAQVDGQDGPAVVENAAARLHSQLLADPPRPTDTDIVVRLPERVLPQVRLPFPSFRTDAGNVASSDDVARSLKALGVHPVPARKDDRLAVHLEILDDADRVRRIMSGLSPEAVKLLNAMLAQPGPASMRQLGVPRHRYRGYGGYAPPAAASPLDDLQDLGLVGVDEWDDRCWPWREVVVALSSRLVGEWPIEPTVVASAVTGDITAVPRVVVLFDRLLARWADQPPPALADGGLGVTPVRATAKSLGVLVGHIGLLAGIARDLDLINPVVVGSTGRGRNRRATQLWTVSPRVEAWAAAPPAERWQRLVSAWMGSTTIEESGGLPTRLSDGWFQLAPLPRRVVVRALDALDPGSGLPRDELLDLLKFRHHWLMRPAHIEGVVEALQVLGLASGPGTVGLTTAGRALLDGDVGSLTAGGATTFHVQGDHTIVTPPDLAAEVLAVLDQMSVVESEAGARVLRLTEESLATALDAGLTAEEIDGFLAEHASAAVPQNVGHLIADVARRHGSIKVASAATVVHCDDPVRLAAAVGIKRAKLRLVAETVAVSSLPEAKVFDALRDKGLMPAVDGWAGDDDRFAPAGRGGEPTLPGRSVPTAGLGPLQPVPYSGPAVLAERAAKLAGT